MTNNVNIYAHPNFDTAVGQVVNGQHPPIEIGSASSMEVAAAIILSWVCRNKYTGDGEPSGGNTPTLIVNVWPFRAPSGERWYIAATQVLDVPINQEVNA